MVTSAQRWCTVAGLLSIPAAAGCQADFVGPGNEMDDEAGASEDGESASDEAGPSDDDDDDAPTGDDDDDDDDDATPSGPWDAGFPIPAAEQVPGDPEAGEYALLHEGYVTCGIPFSLFGTAAGLLGSFADGPALPWRAGKNAEVPYNWTVHTLDDGAEIVSLNCLECHAGYFDGELVVGLGRADADYTEPAGGGLADVPIPTLPIPGISALQEMAQRYQDVGPWLVMPTKGTNPADMLAIVIGAHRDPETLAWNSEPSWEIPMIPLPVDTPPWWRMAKKNALFANGMARGDHRGTLMAASSLCTDSVDEAEGILTYFNNIAAYLRSLEAPPYPFAIDEGLAGQGEPIFLRDCAGCHGTYAADPADETYPNLLLPVDEIGTDPLVAQGAATEPFVDWWSQTWYGQITMLDPIEPTTGYMAPPLDGIWATAPFFHNASVPSLALVLDSTRRPTWWRRVDYDSANFDEAGLGWPYLELDYSWDDAPADERKHVYDTTKLGHWNTGHTYGDHLTDDERAAVLEYLKTL